MPSKGEKKKQANQQSQQTVPSTMSTSTTETKMPPVLIAYDESGSIIHPPILIAYDGSGSTGGASAEFYHKKTQEIVAQHPDAQIVLWDTLPRVISRSELTAINANRKGFGGTESSAISRYILSLKDFMVN